LRARAALRVMEVRAAYCAGDFEWDQLRRLSEEGMVAANVRLLRAAADAAFSTTAPADDGAAPDAPADA